ncbi:MAG: hypothetical protein IT323_12100, partial [Anaerolineae bacterium]|nr:hypothetical protein [Anaerolineae bacterium]
LAAFGAPLFAGTDAFFAELNRGRPPVEVADGVTYSVNPLVHAFDNVSMAETLAAQGVTVQSARAFSGSLPVIVSPVTLKMRWNPNATGPDPAPAPGELPAQVDARQMSLFGAGWTAGSIKHLAQSGAASVTCFETTGWRGVMETAAGSPLPDKFRSIPGGVYPMYHVFADLGEFQGGEVLTTESSDMAAVEGIALRKAGRTRVLLANLSNHPQLVDVMGLSGAWLIKMLDETNAEAAMRDPEGFRAQSGPPLRAGDGALRITLPPYALARLDQG